MNKESLSYSVICSFILTQAILEIKSCSLLLTQGESLNQGPLPPWPPAERLYTKAPCPATLAPCLGALHQGPLLCPPGDRFYTKERMYTKGPYYE